MLGRILFLLTKLSDDIEGVGHVGLEEAVGVAGVLEQAMGIVAERKEAGPLRLANAFTRHGKRGMANAITRPMTERNEPWQMGPLRLANAFTWQMRSRGKRLKAMANTFTRQMTQRNKPWQMTSSSK